MLNVLAVSFWLWWLALNEKIQADGDRSQRTISERDNEEINEQFRRLKILAQ
jgi:hypothetical protein